MSTKKKLIEATYFVREGIYHNVNYMYSLVNLRHILDLYERKKNTPITKELLLRNGFKEYPYGQFEYNEGYVEFDIEWDRGGCYWCDTVLRNVADLEDALDLCGIDKDIEILR